MINKLGALAGGELRARQKQAWTELQQKGTNIHLVEVPALGGDRAIIPVGDIGWEKGPGGGRAKSVLDLRSTLAFHIEDGWSCEEMAEKFVLFAMMPSGLRSFFEENKVSLPVGSGQIDATMAKAAPQVANSFRQVLGKQQARTREDRLSLAERLVVNGARALGVSKDPAESLFSFLDKQAKPGARRKKARPEGHVA